MANPDRPNGLRPIGEIKESIEMIAGARCFPGDALQLQDDGKVDPVAAGGDIYGICLSYADADGDETLISIGADQQYRCQADGADISAQTNVGNMADLVATAGNTTYNDSRQEIDSSTASAATAQMAILGRVVQEDNAFGLNVDLVVKINEHQIIGENDSAGI